MKNLLLYFIAFFITCNCNILFAQVPRVVLPVGHTSDIAAIQFSPDNKLVLTASYDHTAKIWDAATGTLLNTLKGHAGEILSAQFSHDGKMIATVSSGNSKIWNTVTGKLLFTLEDENMLGMRWVCFDSSDNRVLVASGNNKAAVWSITGGKVKQLFMLAVDEVSHPQPLEGDHDLKARFSPNEKFILTFTETDYAKCWDAVTGKFLFNVGNKTYLRHASFSNDGNWLVTDNINQSDKYKTAYFTEPGALWIWSATSGRLVKKINFPGKEIHSIEISPDSRKIIVGSEKGAYIFNTGSWALIAGLKAPFDYYNHTIFFSPDSKTVLTAGSDHMTRIWETGTGLLLSSYKTYSDPAQFSGDGQKVLSVSEKNCGLIYDKETGKSLVSLKVPGNMKAIHSVVISPHDTWMLTVMEDGIIKVWETATATLAHSFAAYDKFLPVEYETENEINHPRYTRFSADDKYIITYQNNDTAKIWEAGSAKLICSFTKKGKLIRSFGGANIRFSNDGNTIIIIHESDSTVIKMADLTLADLPFENGYYEITSGRGPETGWQNDNMKTYKYKNCAEGSCEAPYLGENYTAFAHLHHWVATVTSDETVEITDTVTRKQVYVFFPLDSNDYIYMLPSGYYKPGGDVTKKLHYVTKDLEVMTFEQMDVKYNRPDKVLEATGCTNPAAIESYRNAYYKRLQRLGVDSSSFKEGYSMPVAGMKSNDRVEDAQNTGRIVLQITAKDSIFLLDRFNIWVNDVPLFGMKGISLRNRRVHDFDTTVAVVLSNGNNRIETSVTNTNGIESYRKPLLVKYSPAKETDEKIYFIGVGINEFADPAHNLKWCVQDIRDLTKTLKTKYGDRLVIVDTLFNENATRTNIRSLKKKLYNTTVNDKVIFSYSGHGLLSKEYDYFISSYTINFDNPEEGGIPYDEIENMLDSIPARKKILLLDACNSGEVDKDELKKIQSSATSLAQNQVNISTPTRGVIVTNTDSTARISFQNSFELMQSLFVNVSKGTGAVIISASGGVQFAQERSELGHGVFTYSVIEAMKKFPVITVSAFKKYIGDRVVELTNGLQKPTTRNEPIAVDWEL